MSTPIISREGLLRLVALAQQLRAARFSRTKAACHGQHRHRPLPQRAAATGRAARLWALLPEPNRREALATLIGLVERAVTAAEAAAGSPGGGERGADR